MKAIRERLGLEGDRESGITLIEVMVAMFIFAIISTGVIFTMLSVLQITRDSRSRHVAANLAAQEIDLARASASLFDLVDYDKYPELNGDKFHVHLSTNWISGATPEKPCGAGGGVLRFKRVNVTVTWGGMRASTDAVRADTLIDPNNRINDPTLGTILVSVLNSSGTGSSGVTVTAAPASPANGAQALTVAPKPTDTEGCSYILQVKPGNYDVKITKTGWVTDTQKLDTATATATVAAGTSSSVGFQFDEAGKFTVKLGANLATGVRLPKDLSVSFMSSYGPFLGALPLSGSPTGPLTPGTTFRLHPFASGYQVLAGKYVPSSPGSPPAIPAAIGCTSVDPDAWPATPSGTGELVGAREPAVEAAPGGTAAAADVPLGTVAITGAWGSNGYLRAVSVAPPAGSADPGCDTAMTYTFGLVLPSASGTVKIALPYGSWRLYSGGNSSQTTAIASGLVADAPSGILSGVVTLDPRVVVTP